MKAILYFFGLMLEFGVLLGLFMLMLGVWLEIGGLIYVGAFFVLGFWIAAKKLV